MQCYQSTASLYNSRSVWKSVVTLNLLQLDLSYVLDRRASGPQYHSTCGVNRLKKWSHLKILDTRRVTRSKFHTWGRAVQTLDATVTGRPPFVYCCLTNWHCAANQASVVHLLASHCTDCDMSFPGPGFSQLFEAWSCVNTYKFGCSWQEQHSLNSTKCSYVVGAV